MKYNMKDSKKLIAACTAALLVLAVLCAVSLYQSRYSPAVSRYTLYSPKLQNSVRIVLLSDLHDAQFGDNNSNLIGLVAEQRPDIICFAGDVLNYRNNDTSISVNIIGELSQIAPLYVSLGNHEIMYDSLYDADIKAEYENAGAIVAEQSFFDIELNGNPVRIGGIFGYCLPEKYLPTGEAKRSEADYLNSLMDTDAYTVLLCHMPYTWLVHNGVEAWKLDCVLCGHVHGGQLIIPFIGGAYAPDQGFFPGRLWGLYPSEDGERAMVLTRGLGNTENIPRFNNRPEVLVLDLLSAGE